MAAATATTTPTRWIRLVALIGGVGLVLFGLWGLVAPQSFFDTLAAFEPYNPHLIHDIGAFQLGLGAVLLLAAFPERIDGLAAALVGCRGGRRAGPASSAGHARCCRGPAGWPSPDRRAEH